MIKQMRKIQRAWSVVKKLRGYECMALRLICYYHYLVTKDVAAARYEYEHGDQETVKARIQTSRMVIDKCWSNGWLNDGREKDRMHEVLNIYEQVTEHLWIMVEIYDLSKKIKLCIQQIRTAIMSALHSAC